MQGIFPCTFSTMSSALKSEAVQSLLPSPDQVSMRPLQMDLGSFSLLPGVVSLRPPSVSSSQSYWRIEVVQSGALKGRCGETCYHTGHPCSSDTSAETVPLSQNGLRRLTEHLIGGHFGRTTTNGGSSPCPSLKPPEQIRQW